MSSSPTSMRRSGGPSRSRALKPHIACPTTCGTGSETTGITIVDLKSVGLKTGIASPLLKPSLAIVDPTTTEYAAGRRRRGVRLRRAHACGRVVYGTALYQPTAARPSEPRPPYQGSTPYNDIGASLRSASADSYLARAVLDAGDIEARHQLMFASTLAGLAFGSAGVHIPHAMSYSVATLRHEFTARGYEEREPMVPHGIAVVSERPGCLSLHGNGQSERATSRQPPLSASTCPGATPDDAGEILAGAFISAHARDRPAVGHRRARLRGGRRVAHLPKAHSPSSARSSWRRATCRRRTLRVLYRDALRYW